MRGISASRLLAILLLLPASTSEAGNRGIRVDFGDWSPAQPIGSGACPGTTAGSQMVNWNGYLLMGSVDPKYLVDAYCQTTLAAEFDANSFNGEDSPYISRLVGLNSDNRVTGIRYTFLDSDRFSQNKQGYQWVIYLFPSVRLIGFNNSEGFELTSATYISHVVDDSYRYWNGADNANGDYLCLLPSSQPSYNWNEGTIVDTTSQFSAEYDFGPGYNQNRCIAALTGPFSSSFEDPQ